MTRRKRFLVLGLISLLTLLLCVWFYFPTLSVDGLPSFSQVRGAYKSSEALLLDRNHKVIHEMRIDARGRSLDWIPLDQISPAVKSAVVQAEDRRFYQHHGVDWKAMGAAFIQAFRSQHLRGASTISMQLAALLDQDLKAQRSRRSLGQKWEQIQIARRLEERWSKQEILEAYVNLVSFRGELRGIAAASRGLFGKEPHGLDQHEALLLASLLRAPNARLAQVAGRARKLAEDLKLDVQAGQLLSKARTALSGTYFIKPRVALAPHVATRLLEPGRARLRRAPLQENRRVINVGAPAGGGLALTPRETVVTTLDGELQRFAAEMLRQHILSIQSQNVHDGAVLVTENHSGDVLAYIGSSGDLSTARHVDGVQALRQAGSTLKPFVYALAFEQKILTAASLLSDTPLDLTAPGGVYRPANYDHQFRGLVTARVALASSLNVPAVRALQLVGPAAVVKTLSDLGYRELKDGEYYGHALALGSADVSLWDQVNAYRALANDGEWGEMRLTFDPEISRRKRVFSREAAFLIADILSDRESRSATFGLESPLATAFWTAVKTGTSKDMHDNWCIGYSSQYTVGVWIGNFSGQPMWNVTGITGAAPLWMEIMQWLHRYEPSPTRKAPGGVVQKPVEFAELGFGRSEWFLKGTEPLTVSTNNERVHQQIIHPADGTIVALDPDIPPERQKLFFESEGKDLNLHWVLNGKVLGSAASLIGWKPAPGNYTLSLRDADSRVVDSVQFAVRGAN